MNNKGAISLMQVMILVIGIIAVGYAFGSEVGGVLGNDADGGTSCSGNDNCCTAKGGACTAPMSSTAGNSCNKGEGKVEMNLCLSPEKINVARCCVPSSESPAKDLPVEPDKGGASAEGITNAALPFGTMFLGKLFSPGKKMGGSCAEWYDVGSSSNCKSAGGAWLTDKEGGKCVTMDESDKDFTKCKENYENPSTGKAVGTSLLAALTWAGVTYGLGKLLFPALGAGAGLTDAGSLAAAAAVFSGYFAGSLATELGGSGAWGLIGLPVGAIVFAAAYQEEAQKKKTFVSNPWQAPLGGEHCEECNDEIFGCSEYQCKSLGQACVLVNTEALGEELCTWENRLDPNPPEIRPWEQALISDDYKYVPYDAVFPEDRGVAITYSPNKKGCINAFTPLSFGIMANEAARCKIDFIRQMNFSAMGFDFGGSSTFKYNHTQTMSLPGPSALAAQNMTLENGGEFELYAKCQDANGNFNPGNLVFKFCVDDGPDTTPPLIITTDPLSGLPVAYNVTSLTAMVYVNEPAECKWSHLDQSYDLMENDMKCKKGLTEFNAQTVWPCEADLTGLKNNEENKFYFRCKDQPVGVKDEDRNTNVESYEYILVGSRPLVIDKVGPTGEIEDSTDTVKVKLTAQTSAGYSEGKANCYYNDEAIDAEGEYIKFFETDSHLHSQELLLPAGDYEYFFKCLDLAGNADYSNTTFTVYTDKDEPIVTRIYFEENFLKLSTDEDAECVYDSVDCSYNFVDGIKMSSTNKVDHFTNWNTNENYYIKCKDTYGNEPLPNKCSIISRPFETHYGSSE